MKKKVLILLVVFMLVLTACGGKILIESDKEEHFFTNVSQKVTFNSVGLETSGSGFFTFKWTNRDVIPWSFNGSGIAVYATQNDKEVSNYDSLDAKFTTKINPRENLLLKYKLYDVDKDKPLTIHFEPLEGEEWRLIVDFNQKTIKEDN